MSLPETRVDISRCLLKRGIETECRVQDFLGPSDMPKCNTIYFFLNFVQNVGINMSSENTYSQHQDKAKQI